MQRKKKEYLLRIFRRRSNPAGTNGATFRGIECRRRGGRFRGKLGQIVGPRRRDAREPTFSFRFPRHRRCVYAFFLARDIALSATRTHAIGRRAKRHDRKEKRFQMRFQGPITRAMTSLNAHQGAFACIITHWGWPTRVSSNRPLTASGLPRNRHANLFRTYRSATYSPVTCYVKYEMFDGFEGILRRSAEAF